MRVQRNVWDAVVVGAGAIGCGVARELAGAGLRVQVVDPSPPGTRATWAAGGMLSPLAEAREPGAFLSLALGSLEAWPDFAAVLEEETGEDLGFRLCGKLMIASEQQVDALRERRRWQESANLPVEWVEGAELRSLAPAVGPEFSAGLLLTRDGVVDNRALGRALHHAAEYRGAAFRLGSSVRAVRSGGEGVEGVTLHDGTMLDAGAVVLAAGAWSGGIEGLPRPLPVRPVRGQMLGYLPGRPLLDRVVEGPGCYLIPRATGDGSRLVVGATEEEAGFAVHTTEEGVEGLRAAAEAVLPELGTLDPVEAWAGLRPGTPDDLPFLGEDPVLPGLIHASGHYRNGILLTPITATLIAAAVDGKSPPTAFRPDRFG